MTNMSFNPNIQSSSKPWAEVLEDNVNQGKSFREIKREKKQEIWLSSRLTKQKTFDSDRKKRDRALRRRKLDKHVLEESELSGRSVSDSDIKCRWEHQTKEAREALKLEVELKCCGNIDSKVLDPEHRVNELEDGGHEGRLEPSDLHELKMRNLEYWELLRLHKDIWRQKKFRALALVYWEEVKGELWKTLQKFYEKEKLPEPKKKALVGSDSCNVVERVSLDLGEGLEGRFDWNFGDMVTCLAFRVHGLCYEKAAACGVRSKDGGWGMGVKSVQS
ncbi:hypothetical protein GQ457_06G022320 [Hibiscus cannabinus]